jgi:hypothetical protein
MPIPRRKVRRPAWLHAPRRTARIRLATLYGGLFLASGAALVAATYLLFQRATAFTKPALPQVPRAPSLQDLENLPLPKAYAAVANDQGQVVHILKQLGQPPGTGPLSSTKHLFGGSGPDASLDSGLERDQHQLAQATDHLAQAVHQLAQAGSIQAVQRATDSHELLVNSAIAFGIVAVLALLAGWLVAGRMLRPIRTISRTARRISSTNLHERLALARRTSSRNSATPSMTSSLVSKVPLTPNNTSLPTRPMNCALHSPPSAVSSRLRSTIRTRATPNGAPLQKKCLPRTTNRRI